MVFHSSTTQMRAKIIICVAQHYLDCRSEVSGNVLSCTKPDKPSPSYNINSIATYQYRTMLPLPRVILGFVLAASALTLETVNYLDIANIDGVSSTYGQKVPSTLGPSIGVNKPTWGPYTRVNKPTWGPYIRVNKPTWGPYIRVNKPTWGPSTEVSQPILVKYTGRNQLVTTVRNDPSLAPHSGISQPTFGPFTKVNQPISGPFPGIINHPASTPVVSLDKGTIPTSRLDCNDLVGCEINNSFENSEAPDNIKNSETENCGVDFLNCYNKTSKQSNITVSLNGAADCGNGTTCGSTSPSKLEPTLGANKNLTQIIRDIIVDFERESEFSNYTGVCGTENIPHTITRYINNKETDADGAPIIIEMDTQTQYRTVPLCCHGYRKSLMGHCVPKCDGECLHGDCVSPGNCSCHPRHALDRSGNCVPTCPRSCLNGRCSGNNTCVCNPGFAPSGAICVPV
ncbi:unnamed protein product, partial [Timema podura]|nr:unnamed protein product [Timema podura]